MIVIGLGSGRSGTASLAKLINAQHDALCFHEMNPSCVRFHGTRRPIINTIEEYQRILDGGDSSELTVDLSRSVAAVAYDKLCTMKSVKLIGDIAFYYLSYVEDILTVNPNVRFICLKRNKEATVRSWLKKSEIQRWRSKKIADKLSALVTRQPYYESRNFWQEHDGTEWEKDLVWDKCFPKFDANNKHEAIEQYWDFYYSESEKIAQKYPEVFRLIQTESLNERQQQIALLDFIGVAQKEMVFTDAHIHKLATRD